MFSTVAWAGMPANTGSDDETVLPGIADIGFELLDAVA
jgi:hypothetical protein